MENELIQITESELSKVKNSLLNKEQLNLLLSPTPKEHKYNRPAKGGGEWTYVTGTYVKKVLNLMFGWDWSFEIIQHDVSIEFKQVIVKGKLTVHSNGRDIVKMQFGRQDLKFKNQYITKGNGDFELDAKGYKVKDFVAMASNPMPLDMGNDLKGATTDALKKCASELGIASDVYAPNEYKQISIIEDAEPRTIDELQGLIDNATNIDEMQVLWGSFSKDEQQMAASYMTLKKNEL